MSQQYSNLISLFDKLLFEQYSPRLNSGSNEPLYTPAQQLIEPLAMFYQPRLSLTATCSLNDEGIDEQVNSHMSHSNRTTGLLCNNLN